MYINNINILSYLFIGIIGLGIGQFVSWCVIRLPEYRKVFAKEFFTIYLNWLKFSFDISCELGNSNGSTQITLLGRFFPT